MTTAKKPKTSRTPKKSSKPKPGRGWVTREQLGYAIVWLAGLAMGAWLF